MSEMDVDSRRDAMSLLTEKINEEDSAGDLSDEEEEDEEEEDEEDWLRMSEDEAQRVEEQLATIRSTFKDDVDMFDTTMVAEYADDIFKHMEELELSTLANPQYMKHQSEIEW